jgi:methylglutaconyl-CoA hydratase
MSAYKTIIIERTEQVVTLWLNRPERHNALNPDLMREVIHFFEQLENDTNSRIVVIRGKGPSFCAGADLNWMKASEKLNTEENLIDSRLLDTFFSAVYHSSKVTIGLAHGNIYGGGNGLIAACDLSYALNNSRFSLSETRMGLIAATISPYMLNRLHPSVYKELIFTARPFSGDEAEKYGLVNRSFPTYEALETALSITLNEICQAGPQSLIGSKKLINDLMNPALRNEMVAKIPRILADVRQTPEAKEGFAAFLEKRKPNWH